MRIHPAPLLLLPCLVLSTGCFGDLVDPGDPSDAGTDAGTDPVGSVRGELSVSPLFGSSAHGAASVVGEASVDPAATVDLNGVSEPVTASEAPAGRMPTRADLKRLLRQQPTGLVPAALARPEPLPSAAQVIPGEFLIVSTAAQAVKEAERAGRTVSAQRAKDTRLQVEVLAGALPEHRVRELSAPTRRTQHVKVTHRDGRALTEAETLALVPRLAKNPGIALVEANHRVFAHAVPDDPNYGLQWHYPAMKLPKAWDIQRTATNVVVAVIDSGILQHPDLAPAIISGIDMISDPERAMDGDGRDKDPTDPGGDQPQGRSSWHGTHVAGTIGAVGNNGLGVTGVAWNARILPVRALGKGGGDMNDILAAMEWASGGAVQGVSANATPADVINMSLGGTMATSQIVQDVIDDAVQRGAIFVVSAGNENEDATDKFPCNYERVICVGATRINGTRASYSNFGANVDVMAPGGESAEDTNNDQYADGVLSTYRGTNSAGQEAYNYSFQQGTSMAAPHVTGLVALMKSARKTAGQTLDVDEATTILRSTASTGSRCPEGCGAGLVDAQKALLMTTGQEVPVGPGELLLVSSSLQLTDTRAGSVLLSNVGGSSLTVSASFSSSDGAAVTFPAGTQVTLAAGQTQGLSLQGASSLANGTYHGTLTLDPSAGATRTVSVRLQIGPAPGDGLPVLLVFAYLDDAGEWQAAAGGRVPMGEDGRYRYLAPDVPVGEYVVMGAIDDDEDGEYAEDGERFGMYPTVDRPTTVFVHEDQTTPDIDFAILTPAGVGLPGEAGIGGACTANADCGSGNVCNTSISGGYCTRACESSACPSGSACYVMQGGTPNEFRICMETCTPPGGGRGTCRADLLCHRDGDGDGYCNANCTYESATFCSAGSACLPSGYCG